LRRRSISRKEEGTSVHDLDSLVETMSSIPNTIRGQKYISLKSFRKSGVPVATPVWFGEEDGKLYVMTRSNMGKTKRIRNNPKVQVAPCTIHGQVTGPEFPASARILLPEDFDRARKTLTKKYWLAKLTAPFSRADAFFEISFD
jgi:uncharacterized protein